ncbi:hypothetical protein RB597_003091 [Gaeumannomyces tritici]
MKLSLTVAAVTALLPALSSAHYLFPHLIINGRVTNAHEYNREHDNGFMPLKTPEILTNNDIRCNKGSWNHRRQPKTARVTAGVDSVGFRTALGGSDVFHPGPITIYMSKAPGDVRDYDGSGDWFKVYQLGTKMPWNGKDDGWLTRFKTNFEFKLPAQIPAGQYLIRIEHMAIHQPYRQKELYMMCAHLDVASSYTGKAPGPTIKFPGGYKASDPAFQLDSWANPPPNFAPMPGPAMWPN